MPSLCTLHPLCLRRLAALPDSGPVSSPPDVGHSLNRGRSPPCSDMFHQHDMYGMNGMDSDESLTPLTLEGPKFWMIMNHEHEHL